MDKLLFLDFELNKPLTYLNKFKQLLKDEGWLVDLFWARDYAQEKKPSLDEKINSSDFLIIRKPLTFLTSPAAREKIQEAILKKKRNLLVMYTFFEKESLDVLVNFLNPFKITPSDIKIVDNKTNLENKRMVVFHKKNKCFSHDTLFTNVTKVLIPHPHHLFVSSPAKVLVRGNPTTEVQDDPLYELTDNSDLKGSNITVGAYYDKSGKLVIISSTLFLDNYFDFNKKFIKNVITWLGGKKKKN